jgi:hypothetical protein
MSANAEKSPLEAGQLLQGLPGARNGMGLHLLADLGGFEHLCEGDFRFVAQVLEGGPETRRPWQEVLALGESSEEFTSGRLPC